jgi:hypothetical protein
MINFEVTAVSEWSALLTGFIISFTLPPFLSHFFPGHFFPPPVADPLSRAFLRPARPLGWLSSLAGLRSILGRSRRHLGRERRSSISSSSSHEDPQAQVGGRCGGTTNTTAAAHVLEVPEGGRMAGIGVPTGCWKKLFRCRKSNEAGSCMQG